MCGADERADGGQRTHQRSDSQSTIDDTCCSFIARTAYDASERSVGRAVRFGGVGERVERAAACGEQAQRRAQRGAAQRDRARRRRTAARRGAQRRSQRRRTSPSGTPSLVVVDVAFSSTRPWWCNAQLDAKHEAVAARLKQKVAELQKDAAAARDAAEVRSIFVFLQIAR
jgi:hypothetical protein